MCFVLILSCLEDEVEENEKFQLVLVFFSFSSWVYSFATIFFVLFSALLDTCPVCVCLPMSVITAILSCLILFVSSCAIWDIWKGTVNLFDHSSAASNLSLSSVERFY